MNQQHFDAKVTSFDAPKSSRKAKIQTISKPKRGQANRRERVRTENVNVGFEKLRKLIPTDPEDRKLSKIEVLRLATSYINHLYNLTRANSCLEAETINIESTEISSEEGCKDEVLCLDDDDDDGKDGNGKGDLVGTGLMIDLNTKSTNKTITRNHICTFCLMMTKTATATTTTNKTSGSTKRK